MITQLSCRTVISSFRGLRKECLGPWSLFWRPRTPCILRLGLFNRSPSNYLPLSILQGKYKVFFGTRLGFAVKCPWGPQGPWAVGRIGKKSFSVKFQLNNHAYRLFCEVWICLNYLEGKGKKCPFRCEQDSNLRGKIPLDFESNALTTRPSQHHVICHGRLHYINYKFVHRDVQCKVSNFEIYLTETNMKDLSFCLSVCFPANTGTQKERNLTSISQGSQQHFIIFYSGTLISRILGRFLEPPDIFRTKPCFPWICFTCNFTSFFSNSRFPEPICVSPGGSRNRDSTALLKGTFGSCFY